MKRTLALLTLLSLALALPALGARKNAEEAAQDDSRMKASTFAGLRLRSIGPALTSGRISDVAVHPHDKAHWIVAAASGGVWKTTNHGTTWKPVFDGEGSYSIGCVTFDPNDPNVIWVGTGENNSQRSVSYGDGVYKSVDGGESWTRMGLEDSEHIGMIKVDPRDSNVVYVAAQGPLWRAGGDRGLYKTTDGGQTWQKILEIDEDTGVNEVHFDPRNPDVLYASSYQRRRHVWVLINGGPGSAIYKSKDAGATWAKLEKGIPSVDKGRIGLAVSPADPDVIYAIVEAQDDEGGVFRSTNAGASWTKRSDYMSRSPQYYNELVADPKDVDRVYSLDTWMHVTEDGGASFERVGGYHKHVDDHALWIDPENTDYLLCGNDGGLYDSYDRGKTWRFRANLPITQFYKGTAENDYPFYKVYGGTQDNATLGGSARSPSNAGIPNEDWFVTVFGDGFKTRVDPTNPDIIYSQWQYGGLVRHDRKSGEIIDIQPQPGKGEEGLRWNWNAPLIISPHDPKRLYYGANILFRSDDRGQTWRAVSPDLSRTELDRNTLEVMGRVWSVDAVAKNRSTSIYGNTVALSESPLAEGLLYVGTDDGLLQVSEDGGQNWRRVESFPGVPDMSYVGHVEASVHDPDTVFVAIDNHKRGDFKPYLLVSRDRGKTFSSIAGDLPERGSVHVVMQDHVKADLLFAGTEFGVYFSVDGGKQWIELTGGMPTIAVRDLDIHWRLDDLIVPTFGRGFYILDDYSPLRLVSEDKLAEEAMLFHVPKVFTYVPTNRLMLRGKAFIGDDRYLGENAPFGATFTYHLAEGYKTQREARREKEKEIQEEGGDNPYPSWDTLRAEDREEDPVMILTVRDESGSVVRRVEGPTGKGFHRVSWDLRYPSSLPVRIDAAPRVAPWDQEPSGPMVAPGRFTVELAKRIDGVETPLGEVKSFDVEPLGVTTLPAEDRAALEAFQKKTARLQRAVIGASRAAGEAQTRIDHLRKAIDLTPAAEAELGTTLRTLEERLQDLRIELTGDGSVRSRQESVPPSIYGRVQKVVGGHWSSTSAPTKTHLDNYAVAAELFAEWLPKLQQLVESDLAALEAQLEDAGAPWTPGRVPRWQPE